MGVGMGHMWRRDAVDGCRANRPRPPAGTTSAADGIRASVATSDGRYRCLMELEAQQLEAPILVGLIVLAGLGILLRVLGLAVKAVLLVLLAAAVVGAIYFYSAGASG